uniref:SAM domain-containing protein n=1 Tax=Macrostomum lignano TaxID=282301 RepID=A0A1I8GWL0_9PLAT
QSATWRGEQFAVSSVTDGSAWLSGCGGGGGGSAAAAGGAAWAPTEDFSARRSNRQRVGWALRLLCFLSAPLGLKTFTWAAQVHRCSPVTWSEVSICRRNGDALLAAVLSGGKLGADAVQTEKQSAVRAGHGAGDGLHSADVRLRGLEIAKAVGQRSVSVQDALARPAVAPVVQCQQGRQHTHAQVPNSLTRSSLGFSCGSGQYSKSRNPNSPSPKPRQRHGSEPAPTPVALTLVQVGQRLLVNPYSGRRAGRQRELQPLASSRRIPTGRCREVGLPQRAEAELPLQQGVAGRAAGSASWQSSAATIGRSRSDVEAGGGQVQAAEPGQGAVEVARQAPINQLVYGPTKVPSASDSVQQENRASKSRPQTFGKPTFDDSRYQQTLEPIARSNAVKALKNNISVTELKVQQDILTNQQKAQAILHQHVENRANERLEQPGRFSIKMSPGQRCLRKHPGPNYQEEPVAAADLGGFVRADESRAPAAAQEVRGDSMIRELHVRQQPKYTSVKFLSEGRHDLLVHPLAVRLPVGVEVAHHLSYSSARWPTPRSRPLFADEVDEQAELLAEQLLNELGHPTGQRLAEAEPAGQGGLVRQGLGQHGQGDVVVVDQADQALRECGNSLARRCRKASTASRSSPSSGRSREASSPLARTGGAAEAAAGAAPVAPLPRSAPTTAPRLPSEKTVALLRRVCLELNRLRRVGSSMPMTSSRSARMLNCSFMRRLWYSLKKSRILEMAFSLSFSRMSRTSAQERASLLLLDEVDLVIELVQLLKELTLRDWRIQDVADHLLRHHHLVDKLAEFAADSLAIFQLDIHANGFLLQLLDLLAHVAQVRLELAQHRLHALRAVQ